MTNYCPRCRAALHHSAAGRPADYCVDCDRSYGGPIAAVARELEAAEAAAPALVEVPFALLPPVSQRRAVNPWLAFENREPDHDIAGAYGEHGRGGDNGEV